MIKNMQFDLILLDVKLSDINGIEIIKEIQNSDINLFTKIIVISKDITLTDKLEEFPLVVNIINKSQDLEEICESIQEYIKQIEFLKNGTTTRKEIVKELSYIGYNFKHKGTRYLLEAILYAYDYQGFSCADILEKSIYKYIAYKHKTSVNNVKTNIIRATELAYTCQSEKIINDYFNIEIKMRPKDVINKILTKIAI